MLFSYNTQWKGVFVAIHFTSVVRFCVSFECQTSLHSVIANKKGAATYGHSHGDDDLFWKHIQLRRSCASCETCVCVKCRCQCQFKGTNGYISTNQTIPNQTIARSQCSREFLCAMCTNGQHFNVTKTAPTVAFEFLIIVSRMLGATEMPSNDRRFPFMLAKSHAHRTPTHSIFPHNVCRSHVKNAYRLVSLWTIFVITINSPRDGCESNENREFIFHSFLFASIFLVKGNALSLYHHRVFWISISRRSNTSSMHSQRYGQWNEICIRSL